MRVECAWRISPSCQLVLCEGGGPNDQNVSHGLCPACELKLITDEQLDLSRPSRSAVNTMTLGEVGASETREPAQSCDGPVHAESDRTASAGAK